MAMKTTDLISSSKLKLGVSGQYSRSFTLQRTLTSTKLKSRFAAAVRGYRCSPKPLDPHMKNLFKSLTPSIVTLTTLFLGPDNQPDPHLFLDPTLILTSAHAVGHVSTFKSEEHVLHKSQIGGTAAVTHHDDEQLLKTTPLAVSFSSDLAVLKVVNPHGSLIFPPVCPAVTKSISQPDKLIFITYGKYFCIDRSTGLEKKLRAKTPWPLDDELPWMWHDWWVSPEDYPPEGSGSVNGVVTWTSGIPWFNTDGEIVGIASWEATSSRVESDDRLSLGFAAPHVCIEGVLDYAQTKGPHHPIVMDRWIDSHVILAVDDCDVEKEIDRSSGDRRIVVES